MTYKRTYHTYDSTNKEPGVLIEEYDQPLKDRLIYLAYKMWWNASWRIKPLAWIIDHIADPIAKRLHERHCNNDCAMVTDTATGIKSPACGWWGIDTEMDCKLHRLDVKNNTIIKPS